MSSSLIVLSCREQYSLGFAIISMVRGFATFLSSVLSGGYRWPADGSRFVELFIHDVLQRVYALRPCPHAAQSSQAPCQAANDPLP